MDHFRIKRRLIRYWNRLGFHITRVRRNIYQVNNNCGFSLFYSQTYDGDQEITWFGISLNIIERPVLFDNYFIIFIIDNFDTVLVIPAEIILEIIKHIRLTSKGYYRIHINAENLTSIEGSIDLGRYFNNFRQFT